MTLAAVILSFDDYELDLGAPDLMHRGSPVKIDPVVLSLLSLLACNAGKVVSKEQIAAHVWNGRLVSDNAITVAISRLRKTLRHEAGVRAFVNNVHGRGYQFVRPVTLRAVDAQPESSSLVDVRS